MHITNFAEAGQFEPRKIAAVLRTSAEEIALTVGLGKDALQRRTRIGSDRTDGLCMVPVRAPARL